MTFQLRTITMALLFSITLSACLDDTEHNLTEQELTNVPSDDLSPIDNNDIDTNILSGKSVKDEPVSPTKDVTTNTVSERQLDTNDAFSPTFSSPDEEILNVSQETSIKRLDKNNNSDIDTIVENIPSTIAPSETTSTPVDISPNLPLDTSTSTIETNIRGDNETNTETSQDVAATQIVIEELTSIATNTNTIFLEEQNDNNLLNDEPITENSQNSSLITEENLINQLNNSSFENGDKSNWQGTEGNVTTNNVYSGAYALEVSGDPTKYSLVSQTIPVISGKSYQFSGRIAVAGLTTGSYRFQVRWYNEAGDQLGSVRKTFGITNSNSEYKWHGIELVAAEFAVKAKILLISAKANGSAYFDDIGIVILDGETIPNITSNPNLNFPILEDFDFSDSSNWVIIDDSPAISDWEVIDGVFTQSSEREVLRNRKNRRAALDGTYHLGTYAYLKNADSLTDYRVTLDVTPIKEPGNSLTDDGYDIGFMFRYQDNNNYYRISFNTAYGYARFERKLEGIFSTLAVDARGYAAEGTLIKVDVEVLSNLIQIYINGEPRFATLDDNLLRGGIALYTQDGAQFDNILITENSLEPSIVIDKPIAYTAQNTDTLEVSAVVFNRPQSARVDFDVDGVLCNEAEEILPGYFSSSCPNLSQGEHTVTVFLKENDNLVSSDSNELVGTSGDTRIIIGDSLTNGYGDTLSADNKSSDGKVVAEQGYAGVLQSLLSISNAKPQIIYNEGVPGDDSADTIDLRISSIIERHPDANIAQIMIGTNDLGRTLPVPSGLGCMGNTCKGTYKQNVQDLINILVDEGITPVFSYIPPAFDSDTPSTSERNMLIQEYNSVIQNELTNRELGPDLFNYFLNESQQRISLYSDSLHFNGLGYTIIGHLWEHYINGGTTLPARDQLPLVLEDICVQYNSSSCQYPLTYKQDYMQIGNPYYIDEDYEVLSIPSILNGGIWIKTANADSNNSKGNYLSFSIDRDVEVYLAYDSAATNLPSWLDSYTDIGLEINTTNPNAPSMKLYQKIFVYGIDSTEDGKIKFRGNMADGASDVSANYSIIIKEM